MSRSTHYVGDGCTPQHLDIIAPSPREECLASTLYTVEHEPRCETHKRSPWACLQVANARLASVERELAEARGPVINYPAVGWNRRVLSGPVSAVPITVNGVPHFIVIGERLVVERPKPEVHGAPL